MVLMHGAVALDLCIAPSHRFIWQPKAVEGPFPFGLIGRVAAGQRIVWGSVAVTLTEL
jgi:hypothetical protein